MNRWMRVCAALVAVAIHSTPSLAQPEAYLAWSGVSGCTLFVGCGGTIMRVTPEPPAVLSSVTDPAAEFLESPYITPDGRFLAWFTAAQPGVRPARVALRDTTTDRTTTIDVPGAGAILGNPARSELYVSDVAGVSAWNAAGLRRFAGAACVGTYPVSVSADGRRLLSYCGGDGTVGRPSESRVFDTDSGQLVATLPLWSHAALNRDGSEVYAVEYVGTSQHLRRRQAATGALIGDVPIPEPFPGIGTTVSGLVIDHTGTRVIVTGRNLHVFDSGSLAVLRSRQVALFGQVVYVDSVAVDEAEAVIYLTVGAITEGMSYAAYEVYDLDTLGLTVNISAPARGRFLPVPKPRPPAALSSTVGGSSVALSWTPRSAPPVTIRYVLEVGSAPGRSDIFTGLDVGLQTSFGASGVPPGRYYVRVRAWNYSGLSAPSNEVVVQVP